MSCIWKTTLFAVLSGCSYNLHLSAWEAKPRANQVCKATSLLIKLNCCELKVNLDVTLTSISTFNQSVSSVLQRTAAGREDFSEWVQLKLFSERGEKAPALLSWWYFKFVIIRENSSVSTTQSWQSRRFILVLGTRCQCAVNHRSYLAATTTDCCCPTNVKACGTPHSSSLSLIWKKKQKKNTEKTLESREI